MTDRDQLERDARYVIDVYSERDPRAARVARTLLLALENLVIPEGYAVVRTPELKTKGIPGGRY